MVKKLDISVAYPMLEIEHESFKVLVAEMLTAQVLFAEKGGSVYLQKKVELENKVFMYLKVDKNLIID